MSKGIPRLIHLIEGLASGEKKFSPGAMLQVWFSLSANEKADLQRMFTVLKLNNWDPSSLDSMDFPSISKDDRQALVILVVDTIAKDPEILDNLTLL